MPKNSISAIKGTEPSQLRLSALNMTRLALLEKPIKDQVFLETKKTLKQRNLNLPPCQKHELVSEIPVNKKLSIVISMESFFISSLFRNLFF